mgnify:CR=1 FL=1
MKTNLIITLILFLIMVFFPIITLIDREEKNSTDSSAGTTVSDVKNAETTQHKEKVSEKVSLIVSATGKTTEMSVEEYVYGAVCAEMPASFHIEALKLTRQTLLPLSFKSRRKIIVPSSTSIPASSSFV